MKKLSIILLSLSFFTVIGNANVLNTEGDGSKNIEKKVVLNKKALIVINELINANNTYIKSDRTENFESIINGQSPRVTLISCSDSRVQNDAIDPDPENDLFVIRNIGNQITSNEGSVAYGIDHLHTLVLLIMGHSRCGAVKAAMSDYSGETSSIRKEISTLSSSIGRACSHNDDPDKWINNVVSNVRKQVVYALQIHRKKVDEGEVVIIGAVFDFANDMGKGHLKLNIIDINGEDIEGVNIADLK